MGKSVYVHRHFGLKCSFVVLLIYFLSDSKCFATLSTTETLLNVTTCEVGNVVIDCGTSGVIAIDTVELVYRAGTCTGVYDDADCVQSATAGDRELVLRECSGKSSCTPDLDVTQDFCSSGLNPVSYVHIKYYCIDDSRIKSVLPTETMTSSNGEPLYLTNPSYPSKETLIQDRSCSFEVESCSSDVNLYVFDQDLYNSTSDCSQNITIANEDSAVLKQLECENFYDSTALQFTLSNNFMTITYVTLSAFESYFFIGFAATDSSATARITCPAAAESYCIDCGSLPALTDGTLTLTGDSSYGSTANVQCNQGYDASTTSISCREQGTWASASCVIKDCGSLPALTDGTLALTGGSSYGSTANVQCNQGYDASTTSISCQADGTWESAMCTIKDCGNVPSIVNGTIQLVSSGVTTYEAVADVTCDVGFTASTDTISCLASGTWKTAICKDKPKDDDNTTFATWKIVLIVLALVLIIVAIAFAIYKLCCNRGRPANTVGNESTARSTGDIECATNAEQPNGNVGRSNTVKLEPIANGNSIAGNTEPRKLLPPISSNPTDG